MSWAPYLQQSNNCVAGEWKRMIIKDGVVWASDAFDSVPMRYDDKKIEESKSYPTNGISIDGRKYTYLNNIDGAHIFKNGERSVAIKESNKAVVVIKTDGTPNDAFKVVSATVDAMVQVGF